jgi:gentisate 1,2-dioxygenase
VDDALIADMKKHSVAYIPTLSLDDFAFSYADSPTWVNEPFFRAALDPGVFEMISSPDYKTKTRESKVAKMEEEALPIAKRNLKKFTTPVFSWRWEPIPARLQSACKVLPNTLNLD